MAVHIVHVIVALQEVRHATSTGSTLALPATLLAAVSGSHLRLRSASLSDSRPLKVVIVEPGIGVTIQTRVFCVIAVHFLEKAPQEPGEYALFKLLAKKVLAVLLVYSIVVHVSDSVALINAVVCIREWWRRR